MLPAILPAVSTHAGVSESAIDSLNLLNIASVDRLDINVSGFDFHETSYLLHPTNTANANRVVVVHQGHANDFSLGVWRHGQSPLAERFHGHRHEHRAFLHRWGWNTDTTAIVPGQGTLTYGSHDAMILNTGPSNGGAGFRLFSQAVVQSINDAIAANPGIQDVSMVGLSGGGWTTQLMAAIDPRIKLSVPVAVTVPLNVRNSATQSGTVGDTEQYYTPLYNENIQPNGSGGGVATWLGDVCAWDNGRLGGDKSRRPISSTTAAFPGLFPTPTRRSSLIR